MDVAELLDEIALGIQESAGLAAQPDRVTRRVQLDLPDSQLAEQFAAALQAENTPAHERRAHVVWLEVAPDYTREELDQVVLGVTKVAHYLGLRRDVDDAHV